MIFSMFTIETRLATCVADITREIERKFARQYIGRPFSKDAIYLKVYISEDTYAAFTLSFDYRGEDTTEIPYLEFNLSKEGLDSSSQVFVGCFDRSQVMTLLDALKCAGHVCGDYIKFSHQPISEL